MNKFSCSHFSSGTKFVADGKPWHSWGVSRTDMDSYCVRTGVLTRVAYSVQEIMFHVSRVESIQERGPGVAEVDHGVWATHGWFAKPAFDELSNKLDGIKSTMVYWPRIYIVNALNGLVQPGLTIDCDRLFRAVMANSWVHTVPLTKHLNMYKIDKKRLSRWLKQNHNRFLVKISSYVKDSFELDDALNQIDSIFYKDEPPLEAEPAATAIDGVATEKSFNRRGLD